MSNVIEISEPSFELVEDLYTPGSFELVTAGQHNASLIQFEDFGMVMRTDFQTGKPMLGEDGEPIYRRECAVTFEVDEKDSNGRVKPIKRWMAYSVKNEKHALRMMLETWTGEKLTSGTVNMADFLGKSATLQVLHKPKMTALSSTSSIWCFLHEKNTRRSMRSCVHLHPLPRGMPNLIRRQWGLFPAGAGSQLKGGNRWSHHFNSRRNSPARA